jgi:endonuclease/exonuclease/phosphatase family metal-dependent hydrolase
MTELLPAANVAPSAERSPPREATGVPVRVMSFNVRYGTAKDGPDRWELRHELLVRTIKTFAPDLLGVQEALDFQCDELSKAMGENYAFHGVGRDDGKKKGEFSGIFFNRARFEKLGAGHFWLSETPDKPGSKNWDAELTRMASWVELKDRKAAGAGEARGSAGAAAGTVLFLNTHWDHIGKKARFESARVIRRKIRELHPEGSVIIVGDFNAREDDEEYAELLRAADDDGPRYIDAYRSVHPDRMTEEASFHAFKGGREGSRIDWIFHSDDLKAAEANIDHTNQDGRYPSDHYPVTAVLVRK